MFIKISYAMFLCRNLAFIFNFFQNIFIYSGLQTAFGPQSWSPFLCMNNEK